MAHDAERMAQERERGEVEARLANLERWQEAQNGSLERIEHKVDSLILWALGTAVAGLIAAGGAFVDLVVHYAHP